MKTEQTIRQYCTRCGTVTQQRIDVKARPVFDGESVREYLRAIGKRGGSGCSSRKREALKRNSEKAKAAREREQAEADEKLRKLIGE